MTRKFFDKNWNEVKPEDGVFAVDIEWDDDGIVTNWALYVSESTEPSPMALVEYEQQNQDDINLG